MEKSQFSSLISQQFRLRDIARITGHRIGCDTEDGDTTPLYYYTLHRNADPSPLFTSKTVPGQRRITPLSLDQDGAAEARGVTIDWPEFRKDFQQDSPRTSVVLRLWQCPDKLLHTYGIHLSGLVAYSDLLETRLRANSLVIHARNGYAYVAPDSIDWSRMSTSTVCSSEEIAQVATADDDDSPCSDHEQLRKKYVSLLVPTSTLHSCCTLEQLLKLQQMQLRLKYKHELLRSLIMQIQARSANCVDEELAETIRQNPPPVHHHHHHHHHSGNHHSHHNQGSMGKTLTRLLNMEPERLDAKTLAKACQLRRQIEAVRARCRLLAEERDRTRRYVKQLERQQNDNCDRNVEADSLIMAGYHGLSKDKEKYLHLKLTLTKNWDTLETVKRDWQGRRQTLLRELNEAYEIREHSGGQYTINGITLPDAEAYEGTYVPALSISVALGYVAHLLVVISSILAVPLLNPITFKGTYSEIQGPKQKIYHTDRFPLHCRSMPPPIETKYAILLLNRNIAQLLVHIGHMPKDLRSTLANLISLTKNVQLGDAEQGG